MGQALLAPGWSLLFVRICANSPPTLFSGRAFETRKKKREGGESWPPDLDLTETRRLSEHGKGGWGYAMICRPPSRIH